MASRKIIAGAAAIAFAASVLATATADARNRSGAIAAGALLGIAAGAVIAGAASAAPPPPPPVYYAPAPAYGPPPGDVHAYCFSKYRSYDPSTGTYMGYDGYRRPCP